MYQSIQLMIGFVFMYVLSIQSATYVKPLKFTPKMDLSELSARNVRVNIRKVSVLFHNHLKAHFV